MYFSKIGAQQYILYNHIKISLIPLLLIWSGLIIQLEPKEYGRSDTCNFSWAIIKSDNFCHAVLE